MKNEVYYKLRDLCIENKLIQNNINLLKSGLDKYVEETLIDAISDTRVIKKQIRYEVVAVYLYSDLYDPWTNKNLDCTFYIMCVSTNKLRKYQKENFEQAKKEFLKGNYMKYDYTDKVWFFANFDFNYENLVKNPSWQIDNIKRKLENY